MGLGLAAEPNLLRGRITHATGSVLETIASQSQDRSCLLYMIPMRVCPRLTPIALPCADPVWSSHPRLNRNGA